MNQTYLTLSVIIMNPVSELFIMEQMSLIFKHEHSKVSAKSYQIQHK